jgi:hypothetical protein
MDGGFCGYTSAEMDGAGDGQDSRWLGSLYLILPRRRSIAKLLIPTLLCLVKICRSGLSETLGCDEDYSDDGCANLSMTGKTYSISIINSNSSPVLRLPVNNPRAHHTYAEKDAPLSLHFQFSPHSARPKRGLLMTNSSRTQRRNATPALKLNCITPKFPSDKKALYI